MNIKGENQKNIIGGKKVEGYNQINEEDLWLPNNPTQYFYKFKCRNNERIFWKTFIIKNKKSLLKLLNRYNPLSVYYSVNSFVLPKWADKSKKLIIIKKRTLFDFDYQEIKEVNKLYELLDKTKIQYILKTSTNSYQLLTEQTFTKKEINKLNEGINFDSSVYDNKRVCRLPLTYNIKKGIKHKTKFIFLNDDSGVLGIPKWKMTSDKTSARINDRKAKTKTFAPIFYKAIPNKISKRLYVPYFRYDDFYDGRKIRRLQSKFKLGNLYVFGTDKEVYVLGLKCFELKRLKKIIKYSKCKNKEICFIRISEKIGLFKNEYSELWSKKENINIKKDGIYYDNKKIGKVLDNKPSAMFLLKQNVMGIFTDRFNNYLNYIGFDIPRNNLNDRILECEFRGKVE